MISQPIAKGYLTLYIAEKGDKGDDAEFYDFQALTEKCFVYINSTYPNGCLAIQLQYNILHVKGATTENVTASSSGYHVRFKTNVSNTYYYLSYNVQNPNYTNATFLPNYHTAINKPEWLIVELCYGSSHTVLKQKIIPVVFNTQLLFDINEELNQITSTVQGHTSSIEDLYNKQVGGRNYARNTSDEWSDWITLGNIQNQVVTVCSSTYLPYDKEVGDYYTSQIVIEWSSVEATNDGTFYIAAQTSVDGGWSKPSIWNTNLILHRTEPEDSVVKYVYTYQIQQSNKDAVEMRPAIRIDYARGSFRYKCVKIEKGNTATDWTPAPEDLENGISTISNSMSQIQQTMDNISSTVSTHTTNINTINGQISTINNDLTRVEQKADSITSAVSSIFQDSLFAEKINSGLFFTESDGQTAQSITFNSADKSYKMQCNSSTADIDYSNNVYSNDYRIDKGLYQVSFNVKCSNKNVKYLAKVEIYKNNALVSEKVLVSESESSYYTDDLIVGTFNVENDDSRFKLYIESSYNVNLPTTIWYLTISNINVVMQTIANSVIQQKADTITSKVYETQRDIQTLQTDPNNLFKETVYSGDELTTGNKWLFIPNNKDYIFENWSIYGKVFMNSRAAWETKSVGTTWIYSPYLYMTAGQIYTLNCTFNYDEGINSIDLVRFGTANNAKNIVNPLDTITLGTYLNIEYQEDVLQFTIPSGKTGYYRLRFNNTVSTYYDDYSYLVELEKVRLYKGQFTINEFNAFPEQYSNTYTKIEQTGHSIELKVYEDLNATGIDIENKEITVTADNFTINNNNNEQILGTDSEGNLSITGTVNANNLYHGVTIFIDGGTYKNSNNVRYFYCYDLTEMQDGCEQNGWNDYQFFQEEKYYAWPNANAPHYGEPPTGFIETSYNSEIIWYITRTNMTAWIYDACVKLPRPQDFPGKIVHIYLSRAITRTASSNIQLKIGCVIPYAFSSGIYADATGQNWSFVSNITEWVTSPYKDIAFISFNNRWVELEERVFDISTPANLNN